jgi:hypothetical protein
MESAINDSIKDMTEEPFVVVLGLENFFHGVLAARITPGIDGFSFTTEAWNEDPVACCKFQLFSRTKGLIYTETKDFILTRGDGLEYNLTIPKG